MAGDQPAGRDRGRRLLPAHPRRRLFTWLHFSTNVNPIEIARLKSENEQLRRTNLTFESSVKKLQGQLNQYEERTRQLAIVAGVESLGSGAEAGIGGGSPIEEAGATACRSIESRASQLAGALDAVEARLDERVRWISATPAIAPVKGIFTSGFGYRSRSHDPRARRSIRASTSPPLRVSRCGPAPTAW